MIKALIFIIILSFILLIFIFSKKLGNKFLFLNYFLIFCIILFFVIFFLRNEKDNKKNYIPPTFDGDKIVPGYFDE
jgi:hypothetical protein